MPNACNTQQILIASEKKMHSCECNCRLCMKHCRQFFLGNSKKPRNYAELVRSWSRPNKNYRRCAELQIKHRRGGNDKVRCAELTDWHFNLTDNM